jgi:toxin ParE1/3/4
MSSTAASEFLAMKSLTSFAGAHHFLMNAVMSSPYFSPSARRDLLEILEYIARDNPGAALGHVERLEETCQMLAENPHSGTARDDLMPNLRAWSAGNYVIFFRAADDGIEVERVVHGARDYGKLFE